MLHLKTLVNDTLGEYCSACGTDSPKPACAAAAPGPSCPPPPQALYCRKAWTRFLLGQDPHFLVGSARLHAVLRCAALCSVRAVLRSALFRAALCCTWSVVARRRQLRAPPPPTC